MSGYWYWNGRAYVVVYCHWISALRQCGLHPGEETVVAEDIVDALEAEGSALSLRAARYIRIKRNTEEGLERELRRMCQKSLEIESQDQDKLV